MHRNSSSQIDKEKQLVVLIGQPNSGKTTLFNHLSGKRYKTVNYPGSTVEYHISGFISQYGVNANLLDSPGIENLNPESPDQELAVNALKEFPKYGTPDIIVVTVDSTNLAKHLTLVKTLKDLGFNVVIALTMVDLLNGRGYDIKEQVIAERMECDTVKVNGRTGEGINRLIEALKFRLPAITHKPILKDGIHKTVDELLDYTKSIQSEVIYENDIVKRTKIKRQLKVLNNPDDTEAFMRDPASIRIDGIMLGKYTGLPIFFIIMAFIFTAIFWFAAPMMDFIDESFGTLSGMAAEALGDGWFSSLIADGLIAGVGSVLVFLPQIVILFVILGLLEDSGYLARGATLVNRPLTYIGLNGRSFVPMLSGFACAIPAVMATRTIPNKRERLLTIFILPLMACSARLPVYGLLIAFLIPKENAFLGGLIMASIYIFTILSASVISALISKWQDKKHGPRLPSSFYIELPPYRAPKFSHTLRNTYTSAKAYVLKAGQTIMAISLVLWFITFFPNPNPQVENPGNLDDDQMEQLVSAERLSTSYAAMMGKVIEPVMKPLGMDWRIGVSLIAAFAAREVFVSSLALIFKVTDVDDDTSLLNSMREADTDAGGKLFTTSTIIGLIVFFVFALQCLSTVAITKKEIGSWRIPVIQLILFTALAYILTLVTVNGLRLFGVD